MSRYRRRMRGSIGGRHCPCSAFYLATAGTGIDDIIDLLLGEADTLEHAAIQVGMSLTVKSNMSVKERVVLAGVAPAAGTVRWWNEMSVDAVPTRSTAKILLVDFTTRTFHSVIPMILDCISRSTCLRPFLLDVRNVAVQQRTILASDGIGMSIGIGLVTERSATSAWASAHELIGLLIGPSNVTESITCELSVCRARQSH